MLDNKFCVCMCVCLCVCVGVCVCARLKIDPPPPVGDSGRLVCNLSPATCRIVPSSRPIGNQTRSRHNYPAKAAKEHKHSEVVEFL